MRQNPHVRICGGPGSATTLVYPTSIYTESLSECRLGHQPFIELRPAPPAGDIFHRDGGGLLLADQHDELFTPRDAGVEQIALQHGVVLR